MTGIYRVRTMSPVREDKRERNKMKIPEIYNGTKKVTIYKTRFPELGYCRIEGVATEVHVFHAGTSQARIGRRPIPGQPKGEWRFVDMEAGAAIGPYYTSRKELLSDVERYADIFGCS